MFEPELPHRPIWVVIYRPLWGDAIAQQYGVRELVKVIAADLADWPAIHDREILTSHHTQTIPLQWEIFTRQEDEPFRQLAAVTE